jgi:hypothetical protein
LHRAKAFEFSVFLRGEIGTILRAGPFRKIKAACVYLRL